MLRLPLHIRSILTDYFHSSTLLKNKKKVSLCLPRKLITEQTVGWQAQHTNLLIAAKRIRDRKRSKGKKSGK